MMTRVIAYVRGILTRRQVHREVDEELGFHIDQEIKANIARGFSPTEARRMAIASLGGVVQTREAVREARALWLDTLWRDLRHAVRSLRSARSFSALTLTTLILAVSANLIVFTIVNALWLRPRPVHDPDRVVMVMGDAMAGGSTESFFFAEFGLQTQVRDVTAAFELVAGQVMTSGSNAVLAPRVIFQAAARPLETIGVTSEYFRVLGLTIRGRDFEADDDRLGAAAVAVISDRLWRDAFDGRPDVIGRVVSATPVPIQVIGVAPPDFQGAGLARTSTCGCHVISSRGSAGCCLVRMDLVRRRCSLSRVFAPALRRWTRSG
jgi:hypothetical protein